jgi:lipopolysaccharide transport system ATP-binding protein
MSKAEVDRKFDEIVDFSEIEKFIDTPVKRYSSGMSVRLAFAVAAHLEPEILLVDEVLAVGDLGFQRKSLGKMDDVARSGRTVLFVSHNMAMIQSLCTRGIVLEGGSVVLDAPIDAAINEYVRESEENIEKYALGERIDREGGEAFRFQHVDFLNPDTGDSLETLLSGQAVLIRLTYTCDPEATFHNLRIMMPFYTAEGSFLFTCSNHLVGEELEIKDSKGEMYVFLRKWPLMQGRYFYNLCAGDGRGNRYDYIKEAGKIDVELGSYYGPGMKQVSRTPGVYVDFEWQVHHDEPLETMQPASQTVIS